MGQPLNLLTLGAIGPAFGLGIAFISKEAEYEYHFCPTHLFLAFCWGAVVRSLGWTIMLFASQKGKDSLAFIGSSLYIAGMIGGTAWGLFPNVLPATTNPAHGLTVHNTAVDPYSLSVALPWWLVGMILAAVYFTVLYHMSRGKVAPGT